MSLISNTSVPAFSECCTEDDVIEVVTSDIPWGNLKSSEDQNLVLLLKETGINSTIELYRPKGGSITVVHAKSTYGKNWLNDGTFG